MDAFHVKILETVKTHGLLPAGSKVCAAVSGGADSMSLLCFLLDAREELDISLSAVNIEHGLRGMESIRDSEFVKDFCEKKKVPLKIFMVNALKHAEATRQGPEAAARELRYRSFESMRGRADRVALAHHRGDQAETVLMRLFRGGGAGLSGMDYIRDGFYIRPFLDVSRAEILEYAAQNGVPFVNDSSNADDTYDRNYTRNRVLPGIEQRWPGAEAAIARAARNIGADNRYIESMLPPVETAGGEAGIIFKHFELPDPLINRLIFKALSLIGIITDIEERHISLIKALYSGGAAGATVMLPGGAAAVKDYDRVSFLVPGSADRLSYGGSFRAAAEAGEFIFGNGRIRFEFITEKEYNNYMRPGGGSAGETLFLDYDKIPGAAVIRPRMPGDAFTKFGGGTAPLSDFFIDKKVPARRRCCYPVIAVGSEVFCVCGLEISAKVKVAKKAAKILKITLLQSI